MSIFVILKLLVVSNYIVCLCASFFRHGLREGLAQASFKLVIFLPASVLLSTEKTGIIAIAVFECLTLMTVYWGSIC